MVKSWVLTVCAVGLCACGPGEVTSDVADEAEPPLATASADEETEFESVEQGVVVRHREVKRNVGGVAGCFIHAGIQVTAVGRPVLADVWMTDAERRACYNHGRSIGWLNVANWVQRTGGSPHDRQDGHCIPAAGRTPHCGDRATMTANQPGEYCSQGVALAQLGAGLPTGPIPLSDYAFKACIRL